jgi:hypothetical protein
MALLSSEQSLADVAANLIRTGAQIVERAADPSDELRRSIQRIIVYVYSYIGASCSAENESDSHMGRKALARMC